MRSRQLVGLSLVIAVGVAAAYGQQMDRIAPLRTLPVFHRSQVIGLASAGGPLNFNLAVSPTNFGGPPYTVGPIVTPVSANSNPEAEEHASVDPLNTTTLVEAISDFSQRGGFNTTTYSFSATGGTSWTQQFIPENGDGLPSTSDGGKWQANSDPTVAIDKLGNVFLFNLYVAVNSSMQVTNDGLYVSIGNVTDGVKTTIANTKPIRTSLKPSLNAEDKPWGTVDNSSNPTTTGNVYACWTHFDNTTEFIVLSRSTDHGNTWSRPIRVNPASQNGGVQACQVAVGAKGEVFVAYEVFFTTGNQIWIAKSTSGGASFGAAVAASGLFTELNLGPSATFRYNSNPALAVNPVSDFVYILYAAQVDSSSMIEFIRSTTAGGTTFTPPAAINDKNTGGRVFPAIAADGQGTIATSWFDMRNSPRNADKYDVYATRSLNNGKTWAPNARVTKKTVNAETAVFIGDYSGIAAGDGHAHPVWNNGGLGAGATPSGQLQTADLH